MGDLETLEAVAALSLAADDIEDLVDQLGTLSVVALCPVITSTRLTENEVVGAKELSKRSGTDSVHGTRLQVDEDGTGNELTAGSLVEVDVHALKLEVRGAIVNTGAIEAVLARDGLPEGSTDLVTALACLEVNLLLEKSSLAIVLNVSTLLQNTG
jgi:hypothetical protein